MNIFLYLIAVISIANILLSFSIFLRKKINLDYIFFSILLSSIAIWSLGILGFFYELLSIFRDIWIKVTHIFGLLSSYLFFIFTSIYRINFLKNKTILIISITPILILSYLVLFSNEIIGKTINIEYQIGNLYILYGIIVITYFILGFINLFLKFLKLTDAKDKNIIKIILIGSIFSSLPILIFDLILPYLNIFNYTWLGPLFVYIWIFLIFLAIKKFLFLDIKIISTEFIVFLLWSSIILRFFLTNNLEDILINLIIFIILVPVGIILINSVIKEVEQKEKLEQLNRIKSEFLSFASHQVKSPMAIVKGYSELIESSIEGVPQQAKDFAHKIRESVDNLLVLIEEFMDYRRIEENRIELHFEKVELVNLIKEIVNNFKLIAQNKGLNLNFETEISECYVNVDKIRFYQVIQNLIDNAIKYTKEGWVKINLTKDDKYAIICVADSGIGMSKELKSKLFGEFVRDESIKKEIRGTGLGLYIAKNIIKLHNGEIWAESEGEGKGSKFYVKVPIVN
ncbi:MAG: ATP-binding protein [Patescibacteria group bacterium]|nr:ATP-binding protein [Patescibacteria group bacterium]